MMKKAIGYPAIKQFLKSDPNILASCLELYQSIWTTLIGYELTRKIQLTCCTNTIGDFQRHLPAFVEWNEHIILNSVKPI